MPGPWSGEVVSSKSSPAPRFLLHTWVFLDSVQIGKAIRFHFLNSSVCSHHPQVRVHLFFRVPTEVSWICLYFGGPVRNPKMFYSPMDPVQVGKAISVKENSTSIVV